MSIKRIVQELSVREAGSLGGKEVLYRHGHEHFSRIGRIGQKEMRTRHPGMSRVWGKLGGRPKKKTLAEMVGQENK